MADNSAGFFGDQGEIEYVCAPQGDDDVVFGLLAEGMVLEGCYGDIGDGGMSVGVSGFMRIGFAG